jgi:hypothetical protein
MPVGGERAPYASRSGIPPSLWRSLRRAAGTKARRAATRISGPPTRMSAAGERRQASARYGRRILRPRTGHPAHSALIPSLLTIGHHFWASAFTSAPSTPGVC